MRAKLYGLRGVAGKAMSEGKNREVPSQPNVLGGCVASAVTAGAAVGFNNGAAITALQTTVKGLGGGAVATGSAAAGALLVAGAAGSGCVDFYYRARASYHGGDTLFKPVQGFKDLALRTGSIVSSSFISCYIALEQAIIFLAHMLQMVGHALAGHETEKGYNYQASSDNARECCLHVAGIFALPILNLIDLVGGIKTRFIPGKLVKDGKNSSSEKLNSNDTDSENGLGVR